MTKNTTAIARGAELAKHQIAERSKASGLVKIDKPNRAQRRAAAKQVKRTGTKGQD